ncbi:MAG TPA: FAD-dependent oxidoreductase [Thermoanaerobaculia bacterium]
MPETVAFICDGRTVQAPAGITLAAALEAPEALNGVGARGGCAVLRRSVTGEPRGVLCAMGICFECRVTIDGRAHRRACMEIVRAGMDVRTGEAEFPVSSSEPPVEELIDCDVAVVGGGPAGVAAACRAAEAGARAVLLDEGAAPGGQIHRHLPNREAPPAARAWLARLAQSGAEIRAGVSVLDAAATEARENAAEPWRLLGLQAQGAGGVLAISARAIVLATGSRELFLPFPGWTLPGVYGAGGAQALWKSGASLAGRTAVVGGSGPLLLPVAASLAKSGARVAAVVEQAGLPALAGFALALGRSPSRIRDAVRYRRGFAGTPYRTGAWIAEARGSVRLEGVVLADARGGRRELECDLAAVGWGLTPNTELARVLGCEIAQGRVLVDARQETGVPGVFCAGEACGVAGVEAAVAEGQIAGTAAAVAAGRLDSKEPWDLHRLRRARSGARAVAGRMHRAFRLRPELARLAREDTVVCRCEDVTLGSLRRYAGAREAKLASRAGMGPCQGRVCGPALAYLFGWESDTVRTPIQPAALGALGFAPAERAPEEEGLG